MSNIEIAVQVATVCENDPHEEGVRIVSADGGIFWDLTASDINHLLKALRKSIPPREAIGPFTLVQVAPTGQDQLEQFEEEGSSWSFHWGEANGGYALHWQEGESNWGASGSDQDFNGFLSLLEKGKAYLNENPPRNITPVRIGSLGMFNESMQPAQLYWSVKTALFDADEPAIELVYEHAQGGMSWEFSISDAQTLQDQLNRLITQTGFANPGEYQVNEWLRCTTKENRIRIQLGSGELTEAGPAEWFLVELEHAQVTTFCGWIKKALSTAEAMDYHIFQEPEPGAVEIGSFQLVQV